MATITHLLTKTRQLESCERTLRLDMMFEGKKGCVIATCNDKVSDKVEATETKRFNFCPSYPTLQDNINRALVFFNMRDPYEMEYKGDKIIRHGEFDFTGYYFNADEEMQEVRGKSYREVCDQLDKYNAIVAQIKAEQCEE